MREGIVKLNEPCPHCNVKDNGEVTISGPNFKLTCTTCMKYIKFVGKKDTFKYLSVDVEDDDKVVSNALLEEVNFKLDLLLDYFEIRVTDEN